MISPSFRDAPLGAGPESILTMVDMDSGLATISRPGMTTHKFSSSQPSERSEREPGPIRRGFSVCTRCQTAYFTTNAGGYRSLLSQGRRLFLLHHQPIHN